MKRPPRHPDFIERASLDRLRRRERRFELALGFDATLAAGLAFMLAASLWRGELPGPRLALAWLLLLAVPVGVIAAALRLRARGRLMAATTVLAALAWPAGALGLGIAPVAIAAAVMALDDPGRFRDWFGPGLHAQLDHWASILAFLGVVAAGGIVAGRLGRRPLAIGMAAGAGALLSIVVFGIAGGFLFRHASSMGPGIALAPA